MHHPWELHSCQLCWWRQPAKPASARSRLQALCYQYPPPCYSPEVGHTSLAQHSQLSKLARFTKVTVFGENGPSERCSQQEGFLAWTFIGWMHACCGRAPPCP